MTEPTTFKLTRNGVIRLYETYQCPVCGLRMAVANTGRVVCVPCSLDFGAQMDLRNLYLKAVEQERWTPADGAFEVTASPLEAAPRIIPITQRTEQTPAEREALEAAFAAAGVPAEQLERDEDGNIILTPELQGVLQTLQQEHAERIQAVLNTEFLEFCRQPVLLMARAMEMTLRADEPVDEPERAYTQMERMLFWRTMKLEELHLAEKVLHGEFTRLVHDMRKSPPGPDDPRCSEVLQASARLAAVSMMVADVTGSLALVFPEALRAAR